MSQSTRGQMDQKISKPEIPPVERILKLLNEYLPRIASNPKSSRGDPRLTTPITPDMSIETAQSELAEHINKLRRHEAYGVLLRQRISDLQAYLGRIKAQPNHDRE